MVGAVDRSGGGETRKEASVLGPARVILTWDFPGGHWLRLHTPKCRAPGFDSWSGNNIPHAITKGLHATVKDSTCCS